MNKLFIASASAIATLSVLAGGAVTAWAQDDLRFSFVVKDMTNPYYWRMGEGAARAAEELGIELSWVSAQFNGDIEGQIGVVESELVQSPDALILVPMNATALVPTIRQANNAGIPVITADTRVQEGLVDVETFVGLDESSSFQVIVNYVVEQLDGEGEVAVLEGFRGSSTAEERLSGLHQVLENYPDIEIVASIAADWDRERGLRAAEDILQAHSDVDAIIASNDEMALGAVQAVLSAGRQDDVIVVGDDAIPAALESITSGTMAATIDGNTDLVGYEAVMAAYRHVVDDADLDEWIVVESSLITDGDITPAYLEARGIE